MNSYIRMITNSDLSEVLFYGAPLTCQEDNVIQHKYTERMLHFQTADDHFGRFKSMKAFNI